MRIIKICCRITYCRTQEWAKKKFIISSKHLVQGRNYNNAGRCLKKEIISRLELSKTIHIRKDLRDYSTNFYTLPVVTYMRGPLIAEINLPSLICIRRTWIFLFIKDSDIGDSRKIDREMYIQENAI